jgi:hypothetical protein
VESAIPGPTWWVHPSKRSSLNPFAAWRHLETKVWARSWFRAVSGSIDLGPSSWDEMMRMTGQDLLTHYIRISWVGLYSMAYNVERLDCTHLEPHVCCFLAYKIGRRSGAGLLRDTRGMLLKRICDEGRLFLDRNEPLPGDMGNGKHGKLRATKA